MDLAKKAAQLSPGLALLVGDSVGVVDDEDDALHIDRREEDIPRLSRGDVRSEGVAVGLDILGDLVVALDGGAEEIPCDDRASNGVREREACEDTHEAVDRQFVGEGIQGDGCGGDKRASTWPWVRMTAPLPPLTVKKTWGERPRRTSGGGRGGCLGSIAQGWGCTSHEGGVRPRRLGAVPAVVTGSMVSGQGGCRGGYSDGRSDRCATKAGGGGHSDGRRGRHGEGGGGSGMASPAVFDRRRLVGDPGAAAGRREDEAPFAVGSSDGVRPRDAAVARAMSAARKGHRCRCRWWCPQRPQWLRHMFLETGRRIREEGVVPALVAFPLPLFALLALVVRALVTVAGVGAGRGGNSSARFPSQRRGRVRAVGVTSRESTGAGVHRYPIPARRQSHWEQAS
ncbi:hypothetical protein B0H13DRAFT_1886823 [Mycena leptocephala]|nr:hypothetical protein B0H13DRAFT_1886823 [Mycena leptocephala]